MFKVGLVVTTTTVVGVFGAVIIFAGASSIVNSSTSAAVAASQDEQGIQNISCNASLGPWNTSGGANKGRDDASRLTDEQRGNVKLIIEIGKQRQLPPLAWQIAIQAGMTESGLRNLTYGDRDSLGMFQMRPSMGWGSPAQVVDPHYSINKFYDVLIKLPDWESQRPGDSAQDVERSAFPDRYHKWEAMAAFLISEQGIEDPAGCGKGEGNLLLASNAAGTAIDFAKKQLKEPYLWGGTGPDAWDCSGLMIKAFAEAGVKIPRVANDQYMAGGAYLPVKEAKAGDLIFWATNPANPVTIHHVAMYLGNDEYIHAPQTGDVVKISKINWTYYELMPLAVRPGV